MPDGQVHPNLAKPDDNIAFQYADLRAKFPDGKLTFTLSANNHDCTDTEQVVLTVQIPDEPVDLKLATSEVCSDGGNINFTTVQPATGIITSKLAGAAVKLLGSQWVVDPLKGPYDININDFMINNKPVAGCTLMIHEHPQASFDYKVDIDKEKGIATVTLINKTPNPGSFKFTWTFDDGTISNEVNPVKTFNMGQFPRGRNTVITLTAVNGKFEKCRAVYTPTPPVTLPATTTIPILTNFPPAGTTTTVTTTPPQILVVKDAPSAATTVTPKVDPAVIKETPSVTPTPTVTPKVDPATVKATPAATPTPKIDPAVIKKDPGTTATETPKIDPRIIKKDPGTTDPGTIK
jgi:hypothetical protein